VGRKRTSHVRQIASRAPHGIALTTPSQCVGSQVQSVLPPLLPQHLRTSMSQYVYRFVQEYTTERRKLNGGIFLGGAYFRGAHAALVMAVVFPSSLAEGQVRSSCLCGLFEKGSGTGVGGGPMYCHSQRHLMDTVRFSREESCEHECLSLCVPQLVSSCLRRDPSPMALLCAASSSNISLTRVSMYFRFIVCPSSADARTSAYLMLVAVMCLVSPCFYQWPFVSQAKRGHKCGQGAERSVAPAGRVQSVLPPLPCRLLTGLCGRPCPQASVPLLPLGPRLSRWEVSCLLSLDFSRQPRNCSAYATTCAINDKRCGAGLGPRLRRTRLSSLSGSIALVDMIWMLRLPAWPTCARSGSMQNLHLTSRSGGNS